MSYYHYTKGCHLSKIVRDGVIKTTNACCEKREKPAVWLSKSPEWESACNIGKILNANDFVSGQYYYVDEIDLIAVSNDYMKKKIGMCRILVNESLPTISMAKFKYASKISKWGYETFDSSARERGSPIDKWLCTFSPIPKRYWEGIEMFVDDRWVRWDEKIPIEKFVELCLSCNNN